MEEFRVIQVGYSYRGAYYEKDTKRYFDSSGYHFQGGLQIPIRLSDDSFLGKHGDLWCTVVICLSNLACGLYPQLFFQSISSHFNSTLSTKRDGGGFSGPAFDTHI